MGWVKIYEVIRQSSPLPSGQCRNYFTDCLEKPMADSPLIMLRQLAKQFKGKIKSVNLYDPNVCKWFSSPDAPWALTTAGGEPFSKQLRYTYRDRPIRVFANNRFLNATI